MDKAVFSFSRYSFTESHLRLGQIPDECALSIKFKPTGVFSADDNMFLMNLYFTASYKDVEVVKVSMDAEFKIHGASSIDDIPDYFYPNSIAIVYPYIRAFVSTLTLQSNVHPILLPTINLSSLKDEFRNNTVQK